MFRRSDIVDPVQSPPTLFNSTPSLSNRITIEQSAQIKHARTGLDSPGSHDFLFRAENQ